VCKYCNPSDERKKSSNWEDIDLENICLENNLNANTTAYIVPSMENDRASFVINNDKRIVYFVLNYCPFCGEKLPE